MAGSVETISSYFVLFIIFIWKTIHISLFGHGLMECSIKNSYHRSARHQSLTCIVTNQVCRIVQRCKIITFLNRSNYFFIDHCRRGKFFTTMYHTMSNSTDFLKTLNNTCLFISQCFQHQTDSFCVIRHRSCGNFFFTACRSIGNHTSINTDSFAKTFCDALFCF